MGEEKQRVKVDVWPFSYTSIVDDFLKEPEVLQKSIDFYFKGPGMQIVNSALTSLSTLNFTQVVFVGYSYNYFASHVPIYCFMQQSDRIKFSWHSFEISDFYNYILPQETNINGTTLYVFISQSGTSKMMFKAMEQLHLLQTNPNLVWLVTNNPNSEMKKFCGHIFPVSSEFELVLGTKSFQSTVLVLFFIAQILIGINPLTENTSNKLSCLINQMQKYGETWDKTTTEIMDFMGFDFQFLYVISKGASLSSAQHGALSAKSYGRIYTDALSLGLFFHGPFQLIDKDFRCILLIGDDLGKDYDELLFRLIQLITKKLGVGKVILMCNNQKLITSLDEDPHLYIVNYQCEIPALVPIFEIFIFQMVFLKIAKKRGLLK